MPLKDSARLDRVVRKKIGRLLRGFYEQLRGQRIPARFVELFNQLKEPERAPGDASATPPAHPRK